jgi:hypothetical protein
MAIVAIGASLTHAISVDGYSRVLAMRYLLLFLYTGAFVSIMLNYRVIGPLNMRRRP